MSASDPAASPAAPMLAEAVAAMRRGDPRTALAHVARAEAAAPSDPHVKMQKALIHRAAGSLTEALTALDEALTLDPYNFLALLSKGSIIEKQQGERVAARTYENVLKIVPPDDALPPSLKAPVEHARQVVQRTHEAMYAFLQEKVGTLETGSELAKARLAEAIGVYAGVRRIYHHEPLLLHYPALPAVSFYPREMFPWLPELEAATEMIQGELKAMLSTRMDQFAPYIQYPPDAPVNQWGELNHNPRWSSLFLWKDGQKQSAVCDACPGTAALLERLPMAQQPGFAPTAMFSALDARTRIPAHTGSTNVRLLCHLPLILPGPARFRVGGETRSWEMGKAWVFDDSIDHEAWNDADALRVILIFDVWNPFLEPAERERVNALMAARNAFYAQQA